MNIAVHDEVSGPARIAIGFTAAGSYNHCVSAAIAAFRSAHPSVVVRLYEENSEVLVGKLLEGAINVAFIRPSPSPLGGVVTERLFDEEMVVAVPSDHPLVRHDVASLSELANEPFVFFPRETAPSVFDAVVAACRAAGFTPNVVQIAPQVASTISLVAAGLGLSIVPASIQRIRTPGVAYKRLNGREPRASLGLAFRKGERDPTIRWFIDIARAHAAICRGSV